MSASERRPWLRRALVLGVTYLLVGLVFGTLPASTPQGIRAWRLAAWAVSGAVFAAHIGHECLRLGDPPRSTALHAAVAAALGAFGLALAAIVHSLATSSGNLPLLILALVAWPAITGFPAFLVALVASALLTRIRGRASRSEPAPPA